MNKSSNTSANAAALRQRAEAELEALGVNRKRRPLMAEISRSVVTQLRERRKKSPAARPETGTQRTLHELQVHQIELEMQNAELQETRNRMETQLEKYTDLYDFAPIGYFSLDERGQILEANLTGAAMLGVERSRLINRRLSRFVATASQPLFLAFLQSVFAGTGQQVCDLALVKEDATDFWARFRGTTALSASRVPKWCRVSVSDITAFRQAEDVLRRSEALFTALIQQAPVGVYVVDHQLRLQEVNPKARPVFSKVHPFLGRDFSEVIHILWPEKIANEVLEHFRHTLKTGKPYQSPDFTERRRDTGVTETYEWQLQRITLPAGQHGVVCFFSDITARKRAEEAQRRVEVLAASNRKLEQEIVRRQATENALRQSEQHQRRTLEESRAMQEQLRHLARQVLLVQEEERRNISRELHDVIAQTLTGINIRLATLTAGAVANTKGLQKKIASTQRLVEKSVSLVHRFARELRPAVLDDLGLIPALHSFMKGFAERTGVRTHLKAFAGVEQLDTARRTVLFRVAQEALTNVARHAQASRVEVNIEKLPDAIRLKISDDGKSFNVESVLKTKGRKRLGMLGMRERLEMVGGHFSVESAPGQGTIIFAQIPIGKARTQGGGGALISNLEVL